MGVTIWSQMTIIEKLPFHLNSVLKLMFFEMIFFLGILPSDLVVELAIPMGWISGESCSQIVNFMH